MYDTHVVAVAKRAAETLDQASASSIEAAAARTKADEDRRALDDAKQRHLRLRAAATPFITINRGNDTSLHPAVADEQDALADLQQAELNAN